VSRAARRLRHLPRRGGAPHRLALLTALLALYASGQAAGGETKASPPLVPIALELTFHALPGAVPAAVRVRATHLETSRHTSFEVATRERTTIALERGAWILGLEVDGLWAQEETIVVDQAARITLDVWATARITGSFTDDVTAAEATALWVGFEPSPPAARRPKGSRPCAVQARRWTCEVPATKLDVQLNLPSRSTHYFWDVANAAGHERDLGALRLVPGASIVGWVEGAAAVPATVRLHPPDTPAQSDPTARPGSGLEVRATGRGFFQFVAVRPHEYAVHASAAGAGEANDAVVARTGSEARLTSPLVLRPLATLTVTVDPPRDALGRGWRLQLERFGTTMLQDVVPSAVVPAGGQWTRSALPRGRYLLTLLTPEGHRWASREVAIERPATEVAFNVGAVDIEGRALFGDEPLAATLVFGGSTEERVLMESDADGQFSGRLPRAGRWVVEVVSAGGALSRTLRGVDVALDAEGRGHVSIRLAATILRGIVTNVEGRPASAAIIAFSRDSTDPPVSTRSKTDGTFEVAGLEPGPVTVAARAEGYSSEPVSLDLHADEKAGRADRVHLVLKPSGLFRGRVVSPEGPLWNAQVLVLPVPSSGGGPILSTDEEGFFEAPLPTGTRGVTLIVSARGHVLRILGVPALPEERLAVMVPQQGGTLRLVLPPDGGASSSFLVHEGGAVGTGSLRGWLYRQGLPAPPIDTTELVVPQMAGGAYTACLGAAGALASKIENPQAGGGACVDGVLTVGGDLVLDLSRVHTVER
jgi:hypothetical protein